MSEASEPGGWVDSMTTGMYIGMCIGEARWQS